MRVYLVHRPWFLVVAFAAAAGCSGSSGGGDGGASEAGSRQDGGGNSLDGGLPGPVDAALGSGDAALALDTVDAAGGGTVDSVADAARADMPQPPVEAGPLRDTETDITADAVPGGTDTAAIVSTGNATADRLAAASAACGPQSRLTVPAGWQMVLAGEQGCAFYAPASWLTIGAGTPTTFAVEDQTRVTGSSVMAGVDSTGTATCTPHGVATWLFANNKDCVGFKELYWKDGVDVVAGIQIPRGDLVYSCTQSGVPIVGYLVVQIHGTWPLCNLLAFAFWMPETQIEARTCTLTQTLNSIQCPQGGTGCDDGQCRQECVAAGSLSGGCASDGSCYCTN